MPIYLCKHVRNKYVILVFEDICPSTRDVGTRRMQIESIVQASEQSYKMRQLDFWSLTISIQAL